jgi:hypothetical protein
MLNGSSLNLVGPTSVSKNGSLLMPTDGYSLEKWQNLKNDLSYVERRQWNGTYLHPSYFLDDEDVSQILYIGLFSNKSLAYVGARILNIASYRCQTCNRRTGPFCFSDCSNFSFNIEKIVSQDEIDEIVYIVENGVHIKTWTLWQNKIDHPKVINADLYSIIHDPNKFFTDLGYTYDKEKYNEWFRLNDFTHLIPECENILSKKSAVRQAWLNRSLRAE